jgi:FXSXX-COOH protein
MVMIADDQEPDVASDLQDLRLVPLTEIAKSAAGADMLRRILAEQSPHHVPVAAFNSSI